MGLCLFCGREEATLEHIIPKEMSRRLWEVSPFTPEHGAPISRPAEAKRFYHSKYVDLKISAVCERCNGDFFNRLQDGSKTFWHAAIAGHSVQMDTALKRSVATWAYKTALLMPLPNMPRTEWEPTVGDLARELRIQGRPRVGVSVWTARYDLRDDFPEHVVIGRVGELHVKRGGTEFIGVQVIFTIGYMMYVVIYWQRRGPDGVPREDERYPPSHFIRLWPVFVGDSDWPPDHLFRFSEIDPLMRNGGGLQLDR